MKKILILLIVLTSGAFFVFQPRKDTDMVSDQIPVVASVNKTAEEIKIDEKKEPNRAEELFLVTRVKDGDTIELENGETVRYIGIDTPESVHPQKPVECFGIEASLKNKELVEGKRVRLEKDITDRDKYGRLLRYVYFGDQFINLELVKQGYASVSLSSKTSPLKNFCISSFTPLLYQQARSM